MFFSPLSSLSSFPSLSKDASISICFKKAIFTTYVDMCIWERRREPRTKAIAKKSRENERCLFEERSKERTDERKGEIRILEERKCEDVYVCLDPVRSSLLLSLLSPLPLSSPSCSCRFLSFFFFIPLLETYTWECATSRLMNFFFFGDAKDLRREEKNEGETREKRKKIPGVQTLEM